MVFKTRAKEEFDIEPITSPEMDAFIEKCARVYKGKPEWVNADDDVKTINFAKAICSETARLTTLGCKITIDGQGDRAEWLQKQIDKIFYLLRNWVEYGCGFGTIILKPNGESIDVVTPNDFIVVSQSDDEITGVVFIDRETSPDGKKFYTRLEYHRWNEESETKEYLVTNKCYVGNSKDDLDKPIDIKETPWKTLEEEVGIIDIDKPLYAVFKTPQANNIDMDSAMGLPVFAEALEELRDLDVAYSRHVLEIEESKKIVLLDSDRLLPTGGKVKDTLEGFEKTREEMKLPKYVKNVYGDGTTTFYQEINPEMRSDVRIMGINNLLSQIGYKCGFSNGYFVFNDKTGMATATQIEADQQRTIQLIKDMRDKLEACLDALIYALDKFADLYDLASVGAYETTYDFGDITYNREEDRARWYGYVVAGKIPFWYYLNKFEGISEEEAKQLEEQAMPQEPQLFANDMGEE